MGALIEFLLIAVTALVLGPSVAACARTRRQWDADDAETGEWTSLLRAASSVDELPTTTLTLVRHTDDALDLVNPPTPVDELALRRAVRA